MYKKLATGGTDPMICPHLTSCFGFRSFLADELSQFGSPETNERKHRAISQCGVSEGGGKAFSKWILKNFSQANYSLLHV